MKAFALAGVLLLSFGAQAFDLQGHRGARGLAPENTLPAFERAIALGVTTLELDIAITSDGVLVIHHDTTLNPDTTRDSTGRFLERRGPPIHSIRWAELQTYDVGRLRPGSDYPDQQPLDGTRVPRLSDLFDLVKRLGDDKVRFAIETKLTPSKPEETPAPEPFARAVVEEIRKAGMAARSQILSFDWRTLRVVQAIAPEIPTVYLTAQQSWLDNIGAGRPEGSAWTAGFQHRDHGSVAKMIKAAGGSYWSAYFGDLDAQKVKEAQSLGLKVLVWTVNDPA
ncbi:MAG: glycerophosphodiester phosphodiesterase, partial [Burkholderiales bacterium]